MVLTFRGVISQVSEQSGLGGFISVNCSFCYKTAKFITTKEKSAVFCSYCHRLLYPSSYIVKYRFFIQIITDTKLTCGILYKSIS
jgi:hypothetical protein